MRFISGLVLFAALSASSAFAGEIRVDLASGLEDSHCSRDQAMDQFHRALQILKPLHVSASQLLSSKEGDCHVHGLLRKTSEGFEFIQDYGLPGSQERKMTFHSLDEIVSLFSATQKPAVSANSSQSGLTFSLPAPNSVPSGGSLSATGFDQSPWGAR